MIFAIIILLCQLLSPRVASLYQDNNIRQLNSPLQKLQCLRSEKESSLNEMGRNVIQPPSNNVKRIVKTVIPLLTFFLLFPFQNGEASPLNKQVIPVKTPFFQGWLLRMTDSVRKVSCILIVGSFSKTGSSNYDEHYLFCGVSTPEGSSHAEALPSANLVSISGLGPTSLSPFSPERPLNITWSAKGYGCFKFDGDRCEADFKIGDITVRLNVSRRRPWSRSNPKAGSPEGWLGYTALLPCHYYVHTVSSTTDYAIYLKNSGGNRALERFAGKGFTHMEGNYGAFFPEGWVWVQAIGSGGANSLSLVGGKFTIGIVSPMTWVIYLRLGEREIVFRTTDLAQVRYRIDSPSGEVELNASSTLGNERIYLCIKSTEPYASFSPPIHIPTASGFRNNPGCRETYTALATVTVETYSVLKGSYESATSCEFSLVALEFGGSFQGQMITNDMQ